MSLYSDAAKMVREISEKRQNELNLAAVVARAQNFVAQRKAILAVPEDFRWKSVLELLANTFEIGREDGYPEVSIPDDVARLLRAAYSAGMTCHLRFCDGFACFCTKPDEAAWNADYNAWRAASNYKAAQTVSKL